MLNCVQIVNMTNWLSSVELLLKGVGDIEISGLSHNIFNFYPLPVAYRSRNRKGRGDTSTSFAQ